MISVEPKPNKTRQDKKNTQKKNLRKINMQRRKNKNNLFGTWAPTTRPEVEQSLI